MKRLLLLLLVPCTVLAGLPAPGEPGAPNDPRYCGEPERDANGRIKRDPKVLREFRAVFPCPDTLKPGACPGWAIDHWIPLKSGGCDIQINLTWMRTVHKSCAGRVCKDRWERTYHAIPRQPVNLGKD
jgi:hypothetical protein